MGGIFRHKGRRLAQRPLPHAEHGALAPEHAQGGAVAEGDDAPGARLSGYGLGNGDCCKQDYQDDISCFH